MTSGRALARLSGATGLRARSTAASVIGRPLTAAATLVFAEAAGGASANTVEVSTRETKIPSARGMSRASSGSEGSRRRYRRRSQGRGYSEGGRRGKGQLGAPARYNRTRVRREYSMSQTTSSSLFGDRA